MKKVILMVVVLVMALNGSAALAADMGVQPINPPEIETDPVSLDDIKVGSSIEIHGFGTISLISVSFRDILSTYNAGSNNPFYYSKKYSSGNEADYLILFMDILNSTGKTRNYLSDCSVSAFFGDDRIEYKGWAYQQNYNMPISDGINGNAGGVAEDKNKQNVNWVIDPADNFDIEPYYQGHYVFGCTLPNAIVNSREPLSITITIEGNEITYNVRK